LCHYKKVVYLIKSYVSALSKRIFPKTHIHRSDMKQ
jgi:hypothetical protein